MTAAIAMQCLFGGGVRANWSTFYGPFNIGNPGPQDFIRTDQ